MVLNSGNLKNKTKQCIVNKGKNESEMKGDGQLGERFSVRRGHLKNCES